MLLERDAEIGLLRERLTEATEGRGGVAVVEGPAGAGKSALLSELRQLAGPAQIRTATGGELEREFAFGIVHQLLDPVVRTAGSEQRDRLFSGAAAAAAPLFGLGAGDGGADASFAVLHGLYWLVAALAETDPLVLVVDDAQWADEPSLRFCDFLARRASELPLLLVLGLRPGEAQDVDDRIAELPDATVVRPTPLSVGATRQLVDAALGEEVEEDVVRAAHATTGGNPLLISELARTLASWDGAPTAAVVEAAVPSSVVRSVARRLRRLPQEAQDTARGLAVLGERLPADVLPLHGAHDLAAAGLVEGDPPRFVHPLVRQAIADGVAPSARAAMHGEAAEALRDRPGFEEQVVAHLLAAPSGDRPWSAPILRAAAAKALNEGAAGLAVRRLRRALEETEADPALLVELGMAELATGDPQWSGHLRAAQQAGDDPFALTIYLFLGGGDEPANVLDALRRGADLLDGLEPGPRAALMEAMLLMLEFDPQWPEGRAAVLERARAEGTVSALPVLAHHAAGTGAPRSEVLDLLRAFDEAEGALGPPGVEGGSVWGSIVAAIAMDAPEAVEPVLTRLEGVARRGSSRLVSYWDQMLRGTWTAAFGSLTLAEALLRGALERVEELTDDLLQQSTTAELAATLVRQGRIDEADVLMVPGDFSPIVGATWWARRAEVRAAQGRWAEVLTDLDRAEARLADWDWSRNPIGHGHALRARALMETGDEEGGATLAEELLATGGATDRALALAVLDRHDEAVGIETPDRFVSATVHYELGVRLRRAGQRREARAAFTTARETASRIGAAGLLALATEEFVVAGGRPNRVAVTGVDALTPSERRVAEHAARGLTNRQIAETLFVTRKTVEFTLGRVFQKLDIKSRAQLPERLW